VPKVIDFGIVKATEQKLTDKTLFTQFAQFIGTPAYMSPEQAAMTSLDIDTRSDIYSLGVLLYELLTGTTPFDAQELLKAGFDEMRRIIRETEPVRPSTRLTQSALTGPHSSLATRPSPVATDLDWIVMKCLEKDRNRRYETANGLGADIRRHLSNEPVVARPPSRLYEFQKTVRRHKVGFAGTVAVLLALVGGVGVSSWQAVKAGRAERTAKEQAAIAREQSRIASEQSENATAVKAFLTKTLMGINPCCDTPDPDAISYEATRALVDRVARRLEGQFTDQPLVEADIRLALAAAFGAARDIPAMAIHAEKAVELRQRVLGRAHSDTLEAICDLAFAKYRLGQREQAHELLAEATMLARGSPGGVSLGGGRAIGTRGILLTFDGRAEEALPYLEETLAVLTRLEWPKDKGISKANALKQWMGGRILTVQRTGRLQEAEKLWRDLIQESGRDLGADHPVTMNFQFDLARLLLERKNWHGALPLIQRVVAFRQQTVGENHYITLDARYSLGAAFAAKGDIEAAAGTYAEVYPQFAKYFNLDSARGVSKDMADFFVRQRRYRDARGVFDGFRSWFDANPPQNTADFEWFLRATAATKDWPAAAEVCRKHFDAFPDSLWLWLNKAWIFRFAGDDESYQRVVAQVLALSSSVLATNDQHVPIEIAALGSFPFSAQQVKQLNSMVDALEVALSGRPADLQTWGYRAIGQLQLRLERFDRSLAALEKSAKQQTSPDPYNLFIKAICLHRLARSDEARAAFDQAETIMKAGSLNQPEGFLRTWEIYQQLLMRREAQAALAGTQPNANQRATP
jgi:tetratricopeptide (TPR) repeat protein